MNLKVTLAIGFLSLSGVAFGENWEQVADEDGVKVWQAEVPGTSVFRVRGAATINQPISKLVAVINSDDIEVKKRWIDMLVGVQFIGRDKDSSREYHDYDFPWPANNRDLVLEFKSKLDVANRAVFVTIDSVKLPDFPEDKTTGVRGEAHFNYKLTHLGPNKTGIEVDVWADPKGYLPKFMVNMVNRQWPLQTLGKLERETGTSQVTPNQDVLNLIEKPNADVAH